MAGCARIRLNSPPPEVYLRLDVLDVGGAITQGHRGQGSLYPRQEDDPPDVQQEPDRRTAVALMWRLVGLINI